MSRVLGKSGMALGGLLALLALAAMAGEPPAPVDDVQDLLFLGGRHPVIIRLHIRVGDLPLHAARRDAIGKLHSYLDTDHDGILTRAEAESVEWPRLVRVFRNNRPAPESRLPALDSGLRDGIISTEELAEFVRALHGPLLVQARPSSQPGTETETTFARLDTNGDGSLARDELARAADVLRMLDQNDDETISVAELRPFRNPFFAFQTRTDQAKGAAEPTVVLLGPGESRTRLVQQLLKRFDTGGPEGATTRDRRLSRAELGVGTEAFAAFDGDGDQTLDSDELMQLLERSDPALELIIRLGRNPSKQPVVAVVGRNDQPRDRPDSPAPRIRTSGDTALSLEMGDVWIEVRSEDMTKEFDRVRRQLRALWESLDKDKDKALSLKEAEGREPFRSLLPFMDRDADGKADERELIAALDVLDALALGHASLEVIDGGGSVFGSLDTSGDGRLSLRELRAAEPRLTSFDRDGDLRVTPGEIPRRFEWLISQRPLSSPVGAGAGNRPSMSTATTLKGPLWFQKMDRNRDGNLSPREFLGPHAEFQRLDADGDGLIDDREASEARPAAEKAEPLPP